MDPRVKINVKEERVAILGIKITIVNQLEFQPILSKSGSLVLKLFGHTLK